MQNHVSVSKIHNQYNHFYKISGGLALVFLGVWIGAITFSDGYEINLYTELLGVIATIAVLDQINQWRDQQTLKRRLLREAKGQSNEVAKTAIDWMRDEGWLLKADYIHMLQEIDLSHTQLEGANLIMANLSGSRFRHSNLRVPYLHNSDFSNTSMPLAYMYGVFAKDADFSNSDLEGADLEYGWFVGANFENSKLNFTNFEATDLTQANFRGADMSYSNLLGAKLNDAVFDENTILPDGKYWANDTDFSIYTDSQNPNYWLPLYFRLEWEKINQNIISPPTWIEHKWNSLYSNLK